MLFSSISFLYFFLPVVLLLYFCAPVKMKNMVLLLASLFFYFYGEPVYAFLLIGSSLLGYLHGRWIDRARHTRFARLPLLSSIVTGVGLLLIFKYADFIIENLNGVIQTGLTPPGLDLPIGISFYTFQILSYTIDVYRGKADVQKNAVSLTTYAALFPQLIAGPIVRYTTVETELSGRSHSLADVAYGINRFIIGLAKKILIANTLGELGTLFSQTADRTVLFYWLIAIAFMLQIYFDFSGYSDMAIGLGRVFGFHFLENFMYPYTARSITEFWRRWHISLGTWFRDYVYIPMGGNRVGTVKWIRNILAVWFLTGLWHGAQWNFIVWGLYFALFLVLEKYVFRHLLEQIPPVFSHVYTLFFVLVSFVIFNASTLPEAVAHLQGMAGITGIPLSSPETMYYLRSYGMMLIIAILGATPIVARTLNKRLLAEKGRHAISVLQPMAHIVLLLLCTAYLIDGSFNPFLYFRF